MKLQVITVLAVLTAGCLLDSVEPWLPATTIVETELKLDGSWSVVDHVALFGSGSESVVTLERKPATARAREFFYITIRPKRRDTQFVFKVTLHEIDGLRFIQISNFTHYDDEIFGLANRPTYSLWRIEADVDNILIWMPELGRGKSPGLRTIRDQDDTPLFVDTAANNEAAVRHWVKATRAATQGPRRAMALALTRIGTDFVMPASVEDHMPSVYKGALRAAKEAAADTSR